MLGTPATVALALALPVLSFVVGLAVLLRLAPDYFVRKKSPAGFLHSHRAIRVLLQVARNAGGSLLFLAGMVMALPLVPGPGILFMLIGLGLVDFPGKRALELRLLREPHVLSSVNKMRARFGRPPLQTSESGGRSVVDSTP
jgi:hypothetical protein